MKKSKNVSKSLDNNINNSFFNDSNNKKIEIKKIPKTSRKNSYKNINSSALISIQSNKKYLIEKNYTQMPKSNFLEEMYLKYSKNLQNYFLNNQTGLKLAGNKYFQNLTIEKYMKQYNLTQEEFIQLLNSGEPLQHKMFSNNNFDIKLKNEQFFLTPLPNKSRQLLNTNKEKNDFLEAERAAVVMRTFEYTHGIKSKVGIYEYRKLMMEQKQRLINLMLNAAQKIQRWWKKKHQYLIKSKNDDSFNKRLKIYNDMLNKKRIKVFNDKFCNYIRYLLKLKGKKFFKKLKNKSRSSVKKFYTIFDWKKNIKICKNIKFSIIHENKSKIKKRDKIDKSNGFISNSFLTKKSYISKKIDINGTNTRNYQMKKIIFLQKIFKRYIKIKKGENAFMNGNKTHFSYLNPNKILFLFKKSLNTQKPKSLKKINKNEKTERNRIYLEDEKTTKGNLKTLSPISKKTSLYDENDNGKNISGTLNKKMYGNDKNSKNYIKINNRRNNKLINKSNKKNKNNENNENKSQNKNKNQIKSNNLNNDIINNNQNFVLDNISNNLNKKENDDNNNFMKNNKIYKCNPKNITYFNKSDIEKYNEDLYKKINISNSDDKKNNINKRKNENNNNKDNNNEKFIQHLINFHLENNNSNLENNSNNIKNNKINNDSDNNKKENVKNDVDADVDINNQNEVVNNSHLDNPQQKNLINFKIDNNEIFSLNDANINSNDIVFNNGNDDKFGFDNKINDKNNELSNANNENENKDISQNSKEDSENKIIKKVNYITKKTPRKLMDIKANNNIKFIPKHLDEGLKNIKANTIEYIPIKKNINSLAVKNKIESKNKKRNKLPYNGLVQNKRKIINGNSNNEANFNSSSFFNRQISFGLDNAPSDIIKKNNMNSFLENENINNNSSFNNYYNLNNKHENNNDNISKNDSKDRNNYMDYIKKKSINLFDVEENSFSIINKNNNGQNKNSLLLIDSLEIDNKRKLDKNIIKIISSNEKSLPPEINLDNYQQDSTLDYRDKRNKSNQKTISTSAILRLDTSNNPGIANNQIYNEQNFTFQIMGQICLHYIHRPFAIGNNYIYKIRKKHFSSDYIKSLNSLMNITNNFHKNKLMLNDSNNKLIILNKYFNNWRNISEKEKEPYTYGKIITSICNDENNEKGEHFSYYCKINKSSQENDFFLLRISLGYQLLIKVFCGNSFKIFIYLMKRRRRKKCRAKTFLYKGYSKNIYNLLDFKIKLPILLNKIIVKKYYRMFYHKFIYVYINLDHNFENEINNNHVCALVREGYGKGYFEILFNILKERFNYEYYNTGLRFESFLKDLFSLHK